jgi:hypothetical protein
MILTAGGSPWAACIFDIHALAKGTCFPLTSVWPYGMPGTERTWQDFHQSASASEDADIGAGARIAVFPEAERPRKRPNRSCRSLKREAAALALRRARRRSHLFSKGDGTRHVQRNVRITSLQYSRFDQQLLSRKPASIPTENTRTPCVHRHALYFDSK